MIVTSYLVDKQNDNLKKNGFQYYEERTNIK